MDISGLIVFFLIQVTAAVNFDGQANRMAVEVGDGAIDDLQAVESGEGTSEGGASGTRVALRSSTSVRIRSIRKRTETNKSKRQRSSGAISSERPASARLSCLIKVLLCAPPSMWSVRSKLAKRSIASLTTAK